MLHAAVGKVDFPVEHLHQNLGALTAAILAARPKGIKGGGEPANPPCVSHRAMHAHLWGPGPRTSRAGGEPAIQPV